MLSEGVVPSNIQEGYLARLLFRRAYRLMRGLNMNPEKLYDIIDLQVAQWGKDFTQIKEMRDEIIEMLQVEQEKFEDTLKRGEGIVKRIAADLKDKSNQQISNETLLELYDSHGCPLKLLSKPLKQKVLKQKSPKTSTRWLLIATWLPTKPLKKTQQLNMLWKLRFRVFHPRSLGSMLSLT
jgi:alanyl-tRNA synthetase